KGSSRTPTPTAGGKRTACRGIYCEIIPRPGRGGRKAVGLADTVTEGRRGRRPLRGGCGGGGVAVIRRRAGVDPRPYEGGGGTPWGRRWTKERVVEDADPYGGRETGRVPRDLLRYYPTPLRGGIEGHRGRGPAHLIKNAAR